MNDAIKGGASSLSFNRLFSGAKVKEKPDKVDTPQKAVDSVVAGVDSARHSVEKITAAATTRIEIIRQNENSSRVKVEDVDEAIRLSEKLQLNISRNEESAKEAHTLNTAAIKELLK